MKTLFTALIISFFCFACKETKKEKKFDEETYEKSKKGLLFRESNNKKP